MLQLGQTAQASPDLTGLDEWVSGEVIDVEQNPFRGIVIAIRDRLGRIFFGDERYFRSV